MKLTIEKIVHGGQGLGRVPEGSGPYSGMRVFAPFTLPGETVEASIVEEHRGYAIAKVDQIEGASGFRIEPSCPYFGTCGGCQLQHSDYSYQVEMKREILAESLARAGIRDLPRIESFAGEPFGYRNRIRLRVEFGPPFLVGYRKAKSHEVVAIDRCPIATPLLQRAISAIRSLGAQNRVPADIEELELFTNHDQSELLLTLWAANATPSDREMYEAFFVNLKEEIPQLQGVAALAASGKHPENRTPFWTVGQQNLRYRAGGRDYTVSQGSFFQVNATVLDKFLDAATTGGKGEYAWDLYAGVGLFSLALTERFAHVVAVEASTVAARDLRRNLRNTSARAIHSTVTQFLRKSAIGIAQRRDPPPDLVLLDPPRNGAGAALCNLLAKCAPRSIICVSCDPATLGRDLVALIQSGYRLNRLQLVDMFPQTAQLETIAVLDR